MNLVNTNESFYYQDQTLNGHIFRIFNYRLASYTDFLNPGALECRGSMFKIDQQGNPVRLACLPLHKFFNLYENPMTMNIDLDSIGSIEPKSDGSLISTYIHRGILRLKSKGSLFSDQAVAAMDWLDSPINSDFSDHLWLLTTHGFCCNLEWVSPENRIVLGYMEPRLILLNMRDMETGRYVDIPDDLLNYTAPTPDLKGLTPKEFVEQIPSMLDDIEGFVVKLKTGLWFKCKTNKYLSLHHCKDSVNNPRRLFEVIVDEGIDDVRAMFHTDALLIKQIDEMQKKVDHLFNDLVNTVETFWDNNKFLERKEFAIKAQQEVNPLYFGLVMLKYQNKPIDYKAFAKSKWKQFGFVDTQMKEE